MNRQTEPLGIFKLRFKSFSLFYLISLIGFGLSFVPIPSTSIVEREAARVGSICLAGIFLFQYLFTEFSIFDDRIEMSFVAFGMKISNKVLMKQDFKIEQEKNRYTIEWISGKKTEKRTISPEVYQDEQRLRDVLKLFVRG